MIIHQGRYSALFVVPPCFTRTSRCDASWSTAHSGRYPRAFTGAPVAAYAEKRRSVRGSGTMFNARTVSRFTKSGLS